MQYKCVPAPMQITINNKSSYDGAVRSFADLINSEAVSGWKFHSMESIKVRQDPGCLAGLFGQRGETVEYNMLVFYNEDLKSSGNNWICKKCKNENRMAALFCNSCGEKK